MEAPRLDHQPCNHSESSIPNSPSSRLKDSSVKTQIQDEDRMEELQVQERGKIKNPDLLLDLSLVPGKEYPDQYSKPELNLFHTNTPHQNSANEPENRVFSCNYCNRKFYSSQALGGHQNAHKRERTIARRGQRLGGAAPFGYHAPDVHRYSSMASLPLHGSFNRSLGIQAHSMIHKPSPLASSSSNFVGGGIPLYGHSGWARKPLDQQPAIGRLVPAENNHVGPSSSGGTTRFDGGRRFATAVDGIGGFRWDANGSQLKANNQEELKKLDLSLRL